MQNELEKFPRSLPNDLEDFVMYYPKKFPGVIGLYKELVSKTYMNPALFKEICLNLKKELFLGFYKIKKDFDESKNKDLKFLIRTDQRLHKLFCYRFWIINYLFCDGPLHLFYSQKLRGFAEKIAEWEDPDEKEAKILVIERALFQSDYVDLYLQNTFKSLEIYDILQKIPGIEEKLEHLRNNNMSNKESYRIIDEILEIIKKLHPDKSKEFYKAMRVPIKTAKVRGDNLMVYNIIIHSIEFRENSLKLKERHNLMKEKLSGIFAIAKKKLNPEEFEEFEKVYQMARNFIEAKDIFGMIDPELLPFWLKEVHGMIKSFIPETEYDLGHSAVFRDFVWYLPEDLKAEVMTPDLEPFSLETL